MVSWIGEYSFAGDFFAIIICLVCISVLRSSYTIKQNNLQLYYYGLMIVFCSSVQSIAFHFMLQSTLETFVKQILFFSFQNSVLIGLLVLLLVMLEYLMNLLFYSPERKVRVRIWTWPITLLYACYKFYTPLRGMDIHINPTTLRVENYGIQDNIFVYLYAYLFFWCAATIIQNRELLIEHVYRCLIINAFLAFLIIVFSYVLNISTFICISFTIPILTVLFLFHYNAYDIKMGTLDLRAFRGYIGDMNKKTRFVAVSLYLKRNPMDKNEQLSVNFLQYVQSLFTDRYEYTMFRISNEHFLLIFEVHPGMDFSHVMALLQLRVEYGLKYLYRQYGIPYKLMYIHSSEELKAMDYVDISAFLSQRMMINEIKMCSNQDIKDYQKYKTIDSVLQDIQQTNDLDDERVMVFYQPIMGKDSKCYKAEALMRLKVNDVVYYPGDFLPVVEGENYSHLITKIMLNKVCGHIKELEREGYDIRKISINLSTADLLINDGYKDFIEIVEEKHNLSFGKIAFEILEYNDKVDYSPLVKTMTAFSVISGVEFYLDDFGTGYSNLLRLLSLPVKIIKFDREILRKIHSAPSTLEIIQSNIRTFLEAGYEILFEGVETEEDLETCKQLQSHYFQGFHFSRPIELLELKTYLQKLND